MKDNKKLATIKDVKVFVGIDIGKYKHYVSLIDRDGWEIMKAFEMDCSKAGFDQLLGELKKIASKEDIAVGFEPTGHYFKTLAYFLQQNNYKTFLVNPYHVKLSKELRDNRQRKTDKKDSLLIAHLLREGKFLHSNLFTGNYEDLRRLSIARQRVSKELVRTKVRLRTILDEYLPEYQNCFHKISIKTSLELLKKYNIHGLISGNKVAISRDISRFSHKAISAKKAAQIVDMLRNSIGIRAGLIGAESEILIWVGQIEDLTARMVQIEEKIVQVLEETKEAKYLLSITGVGSITAATVLGQTGSFDRYSCAKKLEKLAGLDLVENSSGRRQGLKHISKRGRDLLRYALCRATIVAIIKNKEIAQFYQYKTKVLKKKKMVAITDLSVKLLRIMFALVKNESLYDGSLVIQGLPSLKR